jgi:hypothetical protein
VSRLAGLLSSGRCEDGTTARYIRGALRRHRGGTAALKLLRLHGGPDLLESADQDTPEIARLRSGARTLGGIVVRLSRTMQAARIEMEQNGADKGMQWILNSLPDLDDNDPADHWDGKESATEWLERTRHLEELRD